MSLVVTVVAMVVAGSGAAYAWQPLATPALTARAAGDAMARTDSSRACGRLPRGARCSLGAPEPAGREMARGEAERVLGGFDSEQQRIAKDGFGGQREGFGGGTSAAKWASAYPDWLGLRSAVLTLADESEQVMMGICADNAVEGVAVLQQWVNALRLPRGRLHGMDKDGKPLDMTNFGSVFIKYSSTGGQFSECGDAMLNGYQGSYRGVYFNPVLADGEFRQYAVLPLQLFDCQDSSPSPSSPTTLTTQAPAQAMPAPAPAPGAEGRWTKTRVEEMISPLMGILSQLGASLEVLAVDHSSVACVQMTAYANTRQVCLDFTGPDVLKFGIINTLQEGGLKEVVFHPDDLPARGVSSDSSKENSRSVVEYDGPGA